MKNAAQWIGVIIGVIIVCGSFSLNLVYATSNAKVESLKNRVNSHESELITHGQRIAAMEDVKARFVIAEVRVQENDKRTAVLQAHLDYIVGRLEEIYNMVKELL